MPFENSNVPGGVADLLIFALSTSAISPSFIRHLRCVLLGLVESPFCSVFELVLRSDRAE